MRARSVLIVVAPLALAGALVTSQRVTATHSDARRLLDAKPAATIDLFSVPPGDPTEAPDDAVTDVYGNEVTAAVATYKFDATGTLYELHSPQTEVPRLQPPKS